MGLLARGAWAATVLSLFAAAPATAQPAVFAGAGISNPIGDFTSIADNGYHAAAALRVGLPAIPVALSLDGAYHRLGMPPGSIDRPSVLAGSFNVVFQLPGVGLRPYLLAGVGRYRLSAVSGSAVSHERGFQAGFGLELGAIGFGGFVEMRYIQIDSPTTTKLVPLTFGVRL